MTPHDAPSVSALAKELGYPTSTEVLQRRFEEISPLAHIRVIVAEAKGEILGWLSAFIRYEIDVETSVEVSAIIVSSQCRGKGVGRHLMADAEAWTQQLGLKQIKLFTQKKRTDAHQFYEKLGYELQKESFKFCKTL